MKNSYLLLLLFALSSLVVISCNNKEEPQQDEIQTIEVNAPTEEEEGETVDIVPVPPKEIEKTPCDELLEKMEEGVKIFIKDKDKKAFLEKFKGWSQSDHFNTCKEDSKYIKKFDKVNADMLEALK
jgi:hypothetical protein